MDARTKLMLGYAGHGHCCDSCSHGGPCDGDHHHTHTHTHEAAHPAIAGQRRRRRRRRRTVSRVAARPGTPRECEKWELVGPPPGHFVCKKWGPINPAYMGQNVNDMRYSCQGFMGKPRRRRRGRRRTVSRAVAMPSGTLGPCLPGGVCPDGYECAGGLCLRTSPAFMGRGREVWPGRPDGLASADAIRHGFAGCVPGLGGCGPGETCQNYNPQTGEGTCAPRPIITTEPNGDPLPGGRPSVPGLRGRRRSRRRSRRAPRRRALAGGVFPPSCDPGVPCQPYLQSSCMPCKGEAPVQRWGGVWTPDDFGGRYCYRECPDCPPCDENGYIPPDIDIPPPPPRITPVPIPPPHLTPVPIPRPPVIVHPLPDPCENHCANQHGHGTPGFYDCVARMCLPPPPPPPPDFHGVPVVPPIFQAIPIPPPPPPPPPITMIPIPSRPPGIGLIPEGCVSVDPDNNYCIECIPGWILQPNGMCYPPTP